MEEQQISTQPDTATGDNGIEEVADIDPKIKKMLEAGLHFGHRKTRQHPKMKPYVFGVRNNISIIDLYYTNIKLTEALEYLKKSVADNKIVLFVDTRPHTKEETRKIAEELGMPYVVERWSGGTITNWKTISERIEYLKDLEAKIKSAEWEKYTKKERYDMEEESRKLNVLWGGVKGMEKLPDIIFVVDMRENAIAIKEARIKDIKIVAIADTNVDPTQADYPIPANDDALSSVKYILNKVKKAMLEGKNKK